MRSRDRSGPIRGQYSPDQVVNALLDVRHPLLLLSGGGGVNSERLASTAKINQSEASMEVT